MAKRPKWKGFRSQAQQSQAALAQQTARREEQFAIEQHIEGKFFSGPLPPADELKSYAEVSPEFPNRIFAMAEKEQGHRHRLEQRRMGAQIWITGAGQVFGFLLAIGIIGLSGWLLLHDKKIEGFVSLLTGLATLIGPFIYRARRVQRPLPQNAPQ